MNKAEELYILQLWITHWTKYAYTITYTKPFGYVKVCKN
jgi:hypothetical protein